MSHLHIPDGVLPLPWILAGFGATAILLLFAVSSIRRQDRARTVPRIAILSAVMLLAMSLPIPVLHYHVNFTVLTGMMAGPAEGFIAGFITNLILALGAHGGITVIGLNTLITGLEITLGWLLWSLFGSRKGRPFVKTAIITIIVLAVSTTAMLGIVAGTEINPSLVMHHHHTHTVHEEEEPFDEADHLLPDHDSHEHGPDSDTRLASFKTFATIVYTAGIVGWAIEAVITGSVVQFISESRPDLIGMDTLPVPGDDDDEEEPRRTGEA